LTLPSSLRYIVHKRLKSMEVSERKQVGDAESMFSQGNSGWDRGYTGGTDSEREL
jgi:hypothetical protein